jgi:hypothetical protein
MRSLDRTFVSEDVGYVTARDNWSTTATVFTFNSGPFPGGLHDQADNNSFTFIARGEPVILDSGASNDRSDGSPSSALGHNGVLIDGRGEGVAGEGAGVSGRIEWISKDHERVFVVGDAKKSFDKNGHNPVRRALRTALFVRAPEPYVLLFDDVLKDAYPHRYEFVLHVPNGDESEFESELRIAEVRGHDGAPVGRVEFLNPSSVIARAEVFISRGEPYRRHRLWRFATDAVAPDFIVLVTGHGLAPEQTRVQRRRRAFVVEMTWWWGVDRVTLPRRTASVWSRLRRREPTARPVLHRSRARSGAQANADHSGVT